MTTITKKDLKLLEEIGDNLVDEICEIEDISGKDIPSIRKDGVLPYYKHIVGLYERLDTFRYRIETEMGKFNENVN